MEKDELYPTGWSHRKFFPPKKTYNSNGSSDGQPSKRQNIDPIAEMLNTGSHSQKGGQGEVTNTQ